MDDQLDIERKQRMGDQSYQHRDEKGDEHENENESEGGSTTYLLVKMD